jgi:ABC-type uncharacterized transport system involved in gliding motility auxiliary subunit
MMYSELKRSFEMKTVEMTADKIPDDVKVLLLVHPKGISEQAQWAIDQFVLRGGKLVALLDPLAVLDPQASGGPFGGGGGGSSSNLEKLLGAWGLKFDSHQGPRRHELRRSNRPGPQPSGAGFDGNAVNKDDILTSAVSSMLFAFAGTFSGTPVDGLKQTVLIHSSKDSQLVEPMMAQMSGAQLKKEFSSSGNEQALALRLTGKFKTAFPDGKPKAAEPAKPDDKPEEKKPDSPAEPGLKEATAEGVVILVGDSDFAQDQLLGREVMVFRWPALH